MRVARKPLPERRTALLLVTRGDRVFLERRPPSGIWGGLWSLPEIPPDDADSLDAARRRFDAPGPVQTGPGFVHGFTHFVLHADTVRISAGPAVDTRCEDPAGASRWVRFDELAQLGLPTPVRALLATRAREP